MKYLLTDILLLLSKESKSLFIFTIKLDQISLQSHRADNDLDFMNFTEAHRTIKYKGPESSEDEGGGW